MKLIQENLDEYYQTNWVGKEDFMRFDAEDHVLSLFSELNRIFADHKMYSRGISLCLHAIQFLEDDPYNFTAYLMTYYCALEKKDNVDEFLAVIEEAYDKVDVDILLPVSIFYYVYGDEERAREVLFEMMTNNTGTERFIFNYDQIDDELDDYYMNEEDDYHPYTFETFAIIYDQMYWYIMDHDDYFTWAKAQLQIIKKLIIMRKRWYSALKEDAMRKIAYIIKFTSKRKYADALCNGSFFMHPAHYYQALQNGRGDALEGAFSHLYIPKKRLYLPIYSLYVVYEDQVHDHRITIDARMMDHFGSYYATIFKWEDWALFMQSHCFTQTYAYGLVTYQDMNLETFTRLVNNHRYEHLLTKRPSYHYQHEFRLIIDDPLSKEEMMIGKMYHATTLMPKGTIVDMKKCLKDHDYFMIDMNGAMIYCDYENLMS